MIPRLLLELAERLGSIPGLIGGIAGVLEEGRDREPQRPIVIDD